MYKNSFTYCGLKCCTSGTSRSRWTHGCHNGKVCALSTADVSPTYNWIRPCNHSPYSCGSDVNTRISLTRFRVKCNIHRLVAGFSSVSWSNPPMFFVVLCVEAVLHDLQSDVLQQRTWSQLLSAAGNSTLKLLLCRTSLNFTGSYLTLIKLLI